MSAFGRWATNTVTYSHAEQCLALDIFRDTRGVKADPETEPDFWDACLEMARQEMERDRYDMDQEERGGFDNEYDRDLFDRDMKGI